MIKTDVKFHHKIISPIHRNTFFMLLRHLNSPDIMALTKTRIKLYTSMWIHIAIHTGFQALLHSEMCKTNASMCCNLCWLIMLITQLCKLCSCPKNDTLILYFGTLTDQIPKPGNKGSRKVRSFWKSSIWKDKNSKRTYWKIKAQAGKLRSKQK